MSIPSKFIRTSSYPTAKTAGQLRSILSELPDDLPVRVSCQFGGSVAVVVYNYGTDSVHAAIEEHDDDGDGNESADDADDGYLIRR